MKKTLLLLIAFCVLGFTVPTAAPTKSFIGYVKGKPVFDSDSERKLFLWDSDFQLLTQYPSGFIPKLVYDDWICFEEKKDKTCKLVLRKGDKEFKYSVGTPLTYLAFNNEGCIYFTDVKDGNVIKHTNDNSVVTSLGVKGYVINVIDSLLYFTKTDNVNLDYANSSLYSYDIKIGKTLKILSDISGESTVISNDGNYLYDQVLHNGNFLPIIYSFKDKKYEILKIKQYAFDSTPFFLGNELLFYNSEELKFTKVKIPFN